MPVAVVGSRPLTFPKFGLQYKTPQPPRAENHADAPSLLSRDGRAHEVDPWGVSAANRHSSSAPGTRGGSGHVLFLAMAKAREGKEKPTRPLNA